MTTTQKDLNEKEWQAFSIEIGKVILRVLQERGITKQRLAEEMGYTQPAVSNTFNPRLPQRCWSGPMLLAVSKVLGIRLSLIIRAAEDKGADEACCALLFCEGYPLGSDKRLEVLINYVAPKGIPDEERKRYYNAAMMEMCSQELVDSYRSGRISDAQMLSILRAAQDAAEGESNLWTALRTYLQSEHGQ